MTGEKDVAILSATDAERLSRLRILRGEARRRADDRSDPGVHLAVIAIDGIGELTIGLCIRRCGIPSKADIPLPARLARLTAQLKIAPRGRKGFEDLHKMRNLVQHEGILPDREQLPLWLAETEELCDELVEAAFEVELDSVGSASGVSDVQLRGVLTDAEQALGSGEAERSFGLSLQALEVARARLRQATGLFPRGPLRAPRDGGAAFSELSAEVRALAEQLELSAFTAEPAEWLWVRQRQGERSRGLPASSADAARAFVFVLSCVLQFESYTERHNVERWERWRAEQKAPETGRPDGPHVRSVELGDAPGAKGVPMDELREWRFQLTDVPSGSPDFDWALWKAVDELDSPLTAAHLSAAGVLSVSARRGVEERRVWEAVGTLIAAGKDVLAQRALEDGEDQAVEEAILGRFRDAVVEAGCPCQELGIRLPRELHRPTLRKAEVVIGFPESSSGSPSYLPRTLGESFPRHFPEHWTPERAPDPYDSTWNNVIVPAFWDARRVASWAKESFESDLAQRAVEQDKRAAADAEEERSLATMEDLLTREPR
jgi:hypothetical protein